MEEQKLDRILKEWAEKVKPDEAKLHFLTEKVLSEVKHKTSQELLQPRGVPLLGLRVTYAILGAVAVCFLISILYHPLPLPTEVSYGEIHKDAQLTREATISAGHIRNASEVVHQLSYLFPESLRWIENPDGKLNIALTSEPYQEKISSDCVLIRLIVFKRKNGGAWQNVWATEAIAAPDGLVEVTSEPETGNHITFWVHLLPDGLLAVDSYLKLKSPVELTTSFSKVLKPGKPENVLSLRSGNVEYCIFEAVRHLQIKRSRSI